VIVAVNVTDVAYVDGFGVEVTAVVEFDPFTTWPPAKCRAATVIRVARVRCRSVYVPAVSAEVLTEVAVPDASVSVSNGLPLM